MDMIYSPGADILARIERCQGFEWDDGNSSKNLDKHRVTTDECQEVFATDPLLKHDFAHSHEEERVCAWGATTDGRLLAVVFTFRDNLIRVISARDMSSKERQKYGTP